MARALGRKNKTSEPAIPGLALLLLAFLSIAWGLNWPMMKLALLEIPVWTFRTLCLMGGGSILLSIAYLSRQPVAIPRGKLGAIALVSLFNITGWHLCSAYGLLNTGSGRAAIIGFTMPLWASVFSVWILKTKPTSRQVLALMFGMAALLTLLTDDLLTLGGAPLGVIFMLLAALNWAFGTILVKKFDWGGMSVLALTGWQQLIGGIPIVMGWLILEPLPDFGSYSWSALGGLAFAVFIAMVFCHTAYFKLVSLLPAHVAAMGVMAVPVMGVVSSAWILGERIGFPEWLALAFVLTLMGLLITPNAARENAS